MMYDMRWRPRAISVHIAIDQIVVVGMDVAPSEHESISAAVRSAVEQAVGAAVFANAIETEGPPDSSLLSSAALSLSRFHSVNVLDAGSVSLPSEAHATRPGGTSLGAAIGRATGAAVGGFLVSRK